MKNLFCRHLLTSHYPLLPLKEMKQKWHGDCVNIKTVSGYPVHVFPPSALVKRSDGYCIRPDQFYFLHTDPRTGKAIRTRGRREHADSTYPVTQEYNPRLCPVQPRLRSLESEFVFLVSPFPVRSKRDLPDSLFMRHEITRNLDRPVVLLNIRPSDIFSMNYYLVNVGKELIGACVNKSNIRAIYPLYDKETVQSTMKKLKDPELLGELKKYFTYSIQRFSSGALGALRELKLKLPEPVRVFRGVFIHNRKELDDAKLSRITTGDVIGIDSRGLPVSWSTDSCISQHFATHTPARTMLGRSKVQFGILFSTVLEPDQVAIDTRLFDPNYFQLIYPNNQQEVITFPTTPDGKMSTFQCKVERLFLIDRARQMVVLVHSFKDILPFI